MAQEENFSQDELDFSGTSIDESKITYESHGHPFTEIYGDLCTKMGKSLSI